MLSGTVLPYHPKPIQGEIFSSWLLRCAHGNHQKLQTFSRALSGKTSFLSRDVDKNVDEKLLAAMCTLTGTSRLRASQTTLRSFEGKIYPNLVVNGRTDWLLPLGIYHRRYRDFGMQFCPVCLDEQPLPHFRLIWRLAAFPVCLEHRCELVDACPRCLQPIMILRSDFSLKNSLLYAPIWACTECSFDLRDCAVCAVEDHELRFYRKLRDTAERGWVALGEAGRVTSVQYFTTLRQLALVYCRVDQKRNFGRRQKTLAPKLRYERLIERRHPNERRSILSSIQPLFQRWPHNFIRQMTRGGIYSSELLRDMKSPPVWYEKVVLKHLYRGNSIDSRKSMPISAGAGRG